MQASYIDKVYRAAIYLRLSKDDGDFSGSGGKQESNSITNQRLLIKSYIAQHPEIQFIEEFCDDGFSGANFDRPAFQRMMDAVRSGAINCVIVKDLSRFGREYIEAGKYVEKIFPQLGVRFIAITDQYDSSQSEYAANDIILPFKNLINDSYCRDISIKIRTNLDAKRRNGEFVGSKTVYGYIRSPEQRSKLIIDEEAAGVVRDIFRWKIEGLSPSQIAARLNKDGILSPIEYKKANGVKGGSGFQKYTHATWSAVTIHRILKNEIYAGVLEQGKRTTPNHKVKITFTRDRSEWSRTENAHEPIISRTQFDLVQRLLNDDTRAMSGEETVAIFSGKAFCADCGSPMIRRTGHSGERTYTYLICSGNKKNKAICSHSHIIREDCVYQAVLAVIQAHISLALDLDCAMQEIEALSWENRELERIDKAILAQQEAIDRAKRMKLVLYEDCRTGLISNDEYTAFKAQYDDDIKAASAAIMQLQSERNAVSGGLTEQQGWLAQFRQYANIQSLDRRVVVSLVDRIIIHPNKEVEVVLMNRNQFEEIIGFLDEQKREVV